MLTATRRGCCCGASIRAAGRRRTCSPRPTRRRARWPPSCARPPACRRRSWARWPRPWLAGGEAARHNLPGLADYGAGALDAARREFARALAADPEYFDALYNSAAVAALSDRADEAIEFLYRAAKADPARVQVLG